MCLDEHLKEFLKRHPALMLHFRVKNEPLGRPDSGGNPDGLRDLANENTISATLVLAL